MPRQVPREVRLPVPVPVPKKTIGIAPSAPFVTMPASAPCATLGKALRPGIKGHDLMNHHSFS